ncbi:MAG: CDP-glycerol glycerophosphotransferase family protein [Spirochaetaceae bacterium]|nr:CDP-glycerol glycerophosphotransferase family protein [Spirochaetaceae bacterium]
MKATNSQITPPPPSNVFSRSKHLLWSLVFNINESLGLIPGIWTSAHTAKLRKSNYKPEHTIDKIAVIANLRFSIEHLSNILSYMDSTEYDIVYLGSTRLAGCLEYARKNNCKVVSVQALIKRRAAYRLAVTICCDNIVQRYGIEFIAQKIFMVQTAIDGSPPYFTDGVSKLPYDYLSCCGAYQKRRIENYIKPDRLFMPGYPRITNHHADKIQTEQIIYSKAKRGINCGKKTILWLPSHTRTTSIYTFAPMLAKIQTEYNIIVKPHPLLLNVEKFMRKSAPEIIVINNVPNEKLFPAADFVICDYGGSVFLAIMADKNVLFFNARDSEAPPAVLPENVPELVIRDRIINFYPDEKDKFFAALKDDDIWEKQKEIRRQIRAEFFTDNPNPARDIADLCRRIMKGEV